VELAAMKASVVCVMRQTENDEAGYRAEISATSAIDWYWLQMCSILPRIRGTDEDTGLLQVLMLSSLRIGWL
jgi:hypothetical protein